MAWIDLAEKYPQEDEEVLFLEPYSDSLGGTKHIGYYDGSLWINYATGDAIGYVTHWLPIPDTCTLIDEMS